MPAMFTVKRLNHMVLYVRDVEKARDFYRDVMGFTVTTEREGRAAFMRASGSDNHHDLGLFQIAPDAPGPSKGDRVGLYHGAWEVATLEDLVKARESLTASGALVGVNDHGTSLSLYAQDPSGNEFEVFWQVPREEWDTRKGGALDIEGEMAKRAAATA
jgi:catechol-2,3-dioxygenase